MGASQIVAGWWFRKLSESQGVQPWSVSSPTTIEKWQRQFGMHPVKLQILPINLSVTKPLNQYFQ